LGLPSRGLSLRKGGGGGAALKPGEPRPEALFLLEDPPGSGAWNMAVDRALLESEGAWLRFYEWSEATISLGWFQTIEDLPDAPEGVPIVRRLTGGGALLHDRELTISLALPEALLPGGGIETYRPLHDAVGEALRALGIPVETAPRRPTTRARGGAAWCFARAAAPDLVLPGSGKIFGSAQRRRRGRILHHGSLFLRAPSRPAGAAALDLEETGPILSSVAAFLGRFFELPPRRIPELPTEISARARRFLEAAAGSAPAPGRDGKARDLSKSRPL